MRLSIPIFHSGKVYTDVEIGKPTGKILADTRSALDDSQGNFFLASKVFVGGCIQSVTEQDEQVITDPVSLKSLISKMPHKTAEQVSREIILKYYNEDDGVEGAYLCPRCGHQLICELKETEDLTLDNRDFISNLKVNFFEEKENILSVQMEDPFVLKDRSEQRIVMEISSYSVEFPTLEHGINAFQTYGSRNPVKLQFALYANALTKINNEKIENRWRNNYGYYFLENMPNMKKDFGSLMDRINQYGVIPFVEKTCLDCGKVWKQRVNTSNFFDSALRV